MGCPSSPRLVPLGGEVLGGHARIFSQVLGLGFVLPVSHLGWSAYRAVRSGMTISDMFFIPSSLFCSYPAHSLALILFDFRVGEHGV